MFLWINVNLFSSPWVGDDDDVWSKVLVLPNGHFQCVECAHASGSKRAMFEHVESKHVGSTQGYPCPVAGCGTVCRSANALRSHSVRHHGTSSIKQLMSRQWFLCFLFLDPEVDLKMARGEDNLWACLVCDYKSRKNTNVKQHIEANHIVGREYSCPFCQVVCKTKNAMQQHSRRHK